MQKNVEVFTLRVRGVGRGTGKRGVTFRGSHRPQHQARAPTCSALSEFIKKEGERGGGSGGAAGDVNHR